MLNLAKQKKTAFAKAILQSKGMDNGKKLLEASLSTRQYLGLQSEETHASARPSTTGGRKSGHSNAAKSRGTFVLDAGGREHSHPSQVKRNRSFGGGFTAQIKP